MTLGERGALAMLGKERVEVAAPRVEVVDTVGAGDSFMSALLSAMDRDHALGAEAPAPNSKRTGEVAALCGDRLGDHLHAQGLRSADARRSRGRARCNDLKFALRTSGPKTTSVAGAERAV